MIYSKLKIVNIWNIWYLNNFENLVRYRFNLFPRWTLKIETSGGDLLLYRLFISPRSVYFYCALCLAILIFCCVDFIFGATYLCSYLCSYLFLRSSEWLIKILGVTGCWIVGRGLWKGGLQQIHVCFDIRLLHDLIELRT